MNSQISFKKYLLICSIGFGIGGMIWGLIIFLIGVSAEEAFSIPFSYIFGAVTLSFIGGISLLSVFPKSNRSIGRILQIELFGLLGTVLGFLLANFFSYHSFFIGRTLLPWLFFSHNHKWVELWEKISKTGSSVVGDLWISFILAGFIIGLFYALGLKTKIWPMVWRGGIGFGLGSLLGPIIGNLFGNLFNSLLASYLIAFAVIGAILGLFLAWGAYINIKNQKSKLQTKI